MAARRIRLRKARRGEALRLSALCRRSKAHWGYDASFMRASRAALTVSPSDIAQGSVTVAENHAGRPLGLYRLDRTGRNVELGLLFVDPAAIGRGVGRALMDHAIEAARRRGFIAMEILADPNAAAFYEVIGARLIEIAPSDAIPGRTLPRYLLRLGRRRSLAIGGGFAYKQARPAAAPGPRPTAQITCCFQYEIWPEWWRCKDGFGPDSSVVEQPLRKR